MSELVGAPGLLDSEGEGADRCEPLGHALSWLMVNRPADAHCSLELMHDAATQPIQLNAVTARNNAPAPPADPEGEVVAQGLQEDHAQLDAGQRRQRANEQRDETTHAQMVRLHADPP